MTRAISASQEWLEALLAQDESLVLRKLRERQAAKQSPFLNEPEQASTQEASSSRSTKSKHESKNGDESDLSWEGTRLTWSHGVRVIRTFTFGEPIIGATWARLADRSRHAAPVSEKGKARQIDDPTGSDGLCQALCVLFKHKVQVNLMQSGDVFDVPLAFTAASIFAAEQGIFIQRRLEREDFHASLESDNSEPNRSTSSVPHGRLPTIFHLNQLLQDVGGVYRVDQVSVNEQGTVKIAGDIQPFADLHERLIYVSGNDASSGSQEHASHPSVLVTRCGPDSKQIRIYAYAIGDQEPLARPKSSRDGNKVTTLPASLQLTAIDAGGQSTKAKTEEIPESEMRDISEVPEESGDRSTRPALQPRKSARLEQERRRRYYGSLAANDATDRSRRISSAGGISLRSRTTSGPDSGSDAVDHNLNMLLDPSSTGLADVGVTVARQRVGDLTTLEDSMMRLPSSSAAGIRRQSSAAGHRRTSSRVTSVSAAAAAGASGAPVENLSTAAGIRVRGSRASSIGASRKSIGAVSGFEPAATVLDTLSVPKSEVPGGRELGDGWVATPPSRNTEELQDGGRSWVNVAMLSEIDMGSDDLPTISLRGVTPHGSVLTIQTPVETHTIEFPRLAEASGFFRITARGLEDAPMDQKADSPTCPITRFFFEGLRALHSSDEADVDWAAVRDRQQLLFSIDGPSQDWTKFCQACLETGSSSATAIQKSLRRARALQRSNLHWSVSIPTMGQTKEEGLAHPNAKKEDTLNINKLHILAQEAHLDTALPTPFRHSIQMLLSSLAAARGEPELHAFWNDWHSAESMAERLLSRLDSEAISEPITCRQLFQGFGLNPAIAAQAEQFCWRTRLIVRLRSASDPLRADITEILTKGDLQQVHRLPFPINSLCLKLLQEGPRREDIQEAESWSPILLDETARPTTSPRLRTSLRFSGRDLRSLPSHKQLSVPWLCGQLFPKDLRLQEVARLFDTTRPQFVRIEKRLDESKASEVQKLRGAINRIKGITAGRGMFLLSSVRFYPTKSWHIPPLHLAVKTSAGERLAPSPLVRESIDMDWPEFHNGVASALQMIHSDTTIDSHWLFHGQGAAPNATHAGFLLGVGLLGKLSGLGKVHAWRYLVNRHSLTSLAIVLGLAATYIGTKDPVAFTLVSIQLPPFLPPDSTALNIPFETQAGSLLGVGLIFLGSDQRSKVDVLVGQIEPPELESKDVQADHREGHALAAGFALGLIMLCKARRDSLESQADQDLLGKLHSLMNGDSLRREGSTEYRHIDIGITSAPATMALALIFLRSNRKDMASRIQIPKVAAKFDELRPDILLARVLARALIMWDDIQPSTAWLNAQMPKFMKSFEPAQGKTSPEQEAVELAYFNYRMALCFAIGLKYAGHGRESDAARVLLGELDSLFAWSRYSEISYFDKVRAKAIHAALDLVGISAAMVMAGTGDEVLLGMLRSRHHNHELPYGNQMATHMGIGLLFLGGGRFNLSSSDRAVALLLIAFFPRFPTVSSDNRAHLQAFRHLWVLAVESRLAVARHKETGRSERVDFLLHSPESDTTQELKTPVHLPQAHSQISVRVPNDQFQLDHATTSSTGDPLVMLNVTPQTMASLPSSREGPHDPVAQKQIVDFGARHPEHASALKAFDDVDDRDKISPLLQDRSPRNDIVSAFKEGTTKGASLRVRRQRTQLKHTTLPEHQFALQRHLQTHVTDYQREQVDDQASIEVLNRVLAMLD